MTVSIVFDKMGLKFVLFLIFRWPCLLLVITDSVLFTQSAHTRNGKYLYFR